MREIHEITQFRVLPSTTSAVRSQITGNGTVSVIAFQTNRVTVIAKDSAGNNIGTGGDVFRIGIFNQCTPTGYFDCAQVPGSKNIVGSPIIANMADVGDGSYYYDYAVQLDGVLTIQVLLLTPNIKGEFFNNDNWSGTPAVTNYTKTIDYDWGDGNITPQRDDNVTAKFSFTLRPPATNLYTIRIQPDGNGIAKLYLGGTLLNPDYTIGFSDYYEMTLNAGQSYSVKIKYQEVSMLAFMRMYWFTDSISNDEIIPFEYT